MKKSNFTILLLLITVTLLSCRQNDEEVFLANSKHISLTGNKLSKRADTMIIINQNTYLILLEEPKFPPRK